MNVDDIALAVTFVSSGYGDNEAYIDTETGSICFVGDMIDELPPEDLFENEKYLGIPDKRELGLGNRLAIEFADEKIPDHLDHVYEIFRRKGAYARFKELLISLDQLDAWYAYEESALEKAITAWCDANGITLGST